MGYRKLVEKIFHRRIRMCRPVRPYCLLPQKLSRNAIQETSLRFRLHRTFRYVNPRTPGARMLEFSSASDNWEFFEGCGSNSAVKCPGGIKWSSCEKSFFRFASFWRQNLQIWLYFRLGCDPGLLLVFKQTSRWSYFVLLFHFFHEEIHLTSFQEDVFHQVGAPLVKNSLAGFNTTLLLYGQVLKP